MSNFKSISILTIGSEILDGRVHDTNSSYIATLLHEREIKIDNFLSCDDVTEDIHAALNFLFSKSEIVIVSGGLGPTTDDITRDAIAGFFGKPLFFSQPHLDQIKALFEKRGRKFVETNNRQAFFPTDSVVIDNPIGTAPGFMMTEKYKNKEVALFSLPGVPAELKLMFNATVFPKVSEFIGVQDTIQQKGMRIFGLSESMIGLKIETLNLDSSIVVSYRAAFPEIHVVLKTRGDIQTLEKSYAKVKEVIGKEFIVSENLEDSLEVSVHKIAIQEKITFSTAESCTAGRISYLLTNTPGSSAYFKGGIATYSNESKENVLGVERELIATHGAVSREVAKDMALNALRKFKSDFAVSITGVAGPDGGSAEKPVGTYYIGFASPAENFALRYFFPNSRSNFRKYASYMALDLLRRKILDLEPIAEYEPNNK